MEPTISSPCPFCETPLQVLSHQISRGVQCPYCKTGLTLEVDADNQPFFRITQPAETDLPVRTPVLRPDASSPRAPCYNCGSTHAPIFRSEMSQAGLVVLIVMLILCFPLFWIGLLIKDTYLACPTCGVRRG